MSTIGESITQGIQDFSVINRFVKGGKSETIQTEGGPIPTLAGVVDGATTTLVNSLVSTSASQLDFGLGPKTFSVQAGKGYQAGQWVSASTTAGYMVGLVVSYVGTILILNIVIAKGDGKAGPWNISFSGPPGPEGKPGIDGIDGDDGEDGTGTGTAVSATLLNKFPWE